MSKHVIYFVINVQNKKNVKNMTISIIINILYDVMEKATYFPEKWFYVGV